MASIRRGVSRVDLIATVALQLTLGSACTQNPRSDAPDDPSVYVAAIDVLFARDSTLRQIVLAEATLAVDSGAVRRALAKMPLLGARDDAAGVTREPFRLSPRAPSADSIRAKHEGVSAVARTSTIERMHAQADSEFSKTPERQFLSIDAYWERFHQEYAPSRTLVRLSPAAYGRDGRFALVYLTYGCGGMCGGSFWVLLERIGAEWRTRYVQEGYVV